MDQVEVSLPFYEYVLDFLAGGPSPQEIVKFRPSVEIQARFSELLAASRERELTLAEEEEFDHYIQIDRMFSLLKAKAYRIDQLILRKELLAAGRYPFEFGEE